MAESWVLKYSPKTSSEVQGQDKNVDAVRAYLTNFRKGLKPLLLIGPPGVGKTSTVYSVANEMDLEIVEINASDFRTKSAIQDIVGGALGQQSLFSKGKVILVDEVDGISGRSDRGGLPTIVKLIKKSAFPVILTANDPYTSKFSKLRRACKIVDFGGLNYLSIAKRLRYISEQENLGFDEDVLKALARKSGGDMRGAINDLQALSALGDLKKEDIEAVGDRKQTESIFNALVRVFKTTDAGIAREAYDDVDVALDDIFLWVDENLPKEYKKALDLAMAYDNLSVADVFFGRIRKWQHYRFYVYCYDLLSAGIALSKDEKYKGFTKYARSTRPLKIWQANNKFAKKKAVAAKVAEKTHTSVNEAIKSTLPYLKHASSNKDFAQNAIEYFELDEDEAKWLKA